jgi:hypothetical protein
MALLYHRSGGNIRKFSTGEAPFPSRRALRGFFQGGKGNVNVILFPRSPPHMNIHSQKGIFKVAPPFRRIYLLYIFTKGGINEENLQGGKWLYYLRNVCGCLSPEGYYPWPRRGKN